MVSSQHLHIRCKLEINVLPVIPIEGEEACSDPRQTLVGGGVPLCVPAAYSPILWPWWNVLWGNRDKQLPRFMPTLPQEENCTFRFSHRPVPLTAPQTVFNGHFPKFCCRWDKYDIKASLMFHSAACISPRYRVQNSHRLLFYSRFSGSMSIITLALA